jgi:hypothetical protein
MDKKHKIGEPPKGYLGVYDHTGKIMLGFVTPASSDANVSRFVGRRGSKLGFGPNGKRAWIGPKPRVPTAPKFNKP